MGIKIADQYSLLHIASGIIAYFWGISFNMWFIIHFMFEFIENTELGINFINTWLKNIWPGGKQYPDSIQNTISDTAFGLIGWLFAYMIDYYGNKFGWYEMHIARNKLSS